jgi:hypothetical protein
MDLRSHHILCTVIMAAACASSAGSPPPAPVDRVVIVGTDGNSIRQSANDNTQAVFAAKPDRVWAALIGAYSELGIVPSITDRPSGVYGNRGFVFPSRFHDRPVEEYFDCGSGLSANSASSGRLVALVESQMSAASDSETTVATRVTGRLRSNAGTSTSAIDCASRGSVEHFLQTEVARRLLLKP